MAVVSHNTEIEEWRDVADWIGFYQVSNLGRIKSLARTYIANRKGKPSEVRVKEKIVLGYFTQGYPAVTLCGKGVQSKRYVHDIVCTAWHGARPKDHDVAHGDGIKTNCHAENLRWATRQDNLADKVRHGTQKRGDDLWFTKLTDEQVKQVRQQTNITQKEFAERFGVSQSLIGLIRANKRRVVT